MNRFISFEYISAQAGARRAQNVLGAQACLAGGAQLLRRESLEAIGGEIDTSSLAEDTFTTFNVQLAGKRVVFEPHAIVWAEEPRDIAGLWKQRVRWGRGNVQVTLRYRRTWFRRSAGRLGGVSFALIWFSVFLMPALMVLSSASLVTLFVLDRELSIDAFRSLWALNLVTYAFVTLSAFAQDGPAARRSWLEAITFPGLISLAIIAWTTADPVPRRAAGLAAAVRLRVAVGLDARRVSRQAARASSPSPAGSLRCCSTWSGTGRCCARSPPRRTCPSCGARTWRGRRPRRPARWETWRERRLRRRAGRRRALRAPPVLAPAGHRGAGGGPDRAPHRGWADPWAQQEASHRTRAAFGLAVIAGPLSALLPGPDIDPLLFGLACALTLALLVVGSLPSVRASQPAQLWLALAYLGLVAMMRGATDGPAPGFVPLLVLPALWLALYGTRRQLLIELGATLATLLLPWALIGGDQYPASTPRSALLILTVAAIAGLSIQRLLGEVRANRDRLSGVLSAATGNAIVATDLSGTITVFNPGAERMLGYRAEEVVGTRHAGAVPRGRRARTTTRPRSASSRRSRPSRRPRGRRGRGRRAS